MKIRGYILRTSQIIRLNTGCIVVVKLLSEANEVQNVIIKDTSLFELAKSLLPGDLIDWSHLRSTLHLKQIVKAIRTPETLLIATSASKLLKLDNDCKNNSLISQLDIFMQEREQLIDYKGYVTKVVDSDLCIYELDNQYPICTVFIKEYTNLKLFNINDLLKLEFMHVVCENSKKWILCCGYSHVEVISSSNREIPTSSIYPFLVTCLGVPFNLLKWFKRSVEALTQHLTPDFISFKKLTYAEKHTEVIVRPTYATGILSILMSCSHLLNIPILHQRIQSSMISDFISSPHSCSCSASIFFKQPVFQPNFPPVLDLCNQISEMKISNQKLWNFEKLFSLDCNPKMVAVGCLTSTLDGSLYLHDKTGAILCVPIESTKKDETECVVEHPNSDIKLNYLVAIGKFHMITETVSLPNNPPLNYLLFKKQDLVYLQNKPLLKEQRPNIELSPGVLALSKCNDKKIKVLVSQLFVVRNKTLPVLGKESWTYEFQCDTTALSNVVFEVEWESFLKRPSNTSSSTELLQDDRLCENLQSLSIEELDSLKLDETTRHEIENRKTRVFVFSEDLVADYSCLQIGQTFLLKTPIILPIINNLVNELNVAIRQWSATNPFILPQVVQIVHYKKASNLCPVHCSNDKKVFEEWNLKLINEQCLCKFEKPKSYSVGIINSGSLMPNGIDSIDVRGIIRHKCIFENKDRRTDTEPMLTIALTIQDENHSDLAIRLYINHSLPSNLLCGLLPGISVHVSGVKCVESANRNIYLKSTNKFGLTIYKNSSDIFDTDLEDQELKISLPDVKFFQNLKSSETFCSISTILRVLRVTIHPLFMDSKNMEIKARFEVDDGSQKLVAFCSNDNVQNLLKLSTSDWGKVLNLASERENGICYDYFNSRKVVRQNKNFFQVLCSRSEICRQVMIHCRSYQDHRTRHNDGIPSQNNISLFCILLKEPSPIELSLELLKNIKNEKYL